ncbi:MAG: malate:quinone oxidoreductase [Caryophanon sp.]|nr:malate:quinone oxidoreductase [Caryophanon sp.]
MSNQKQTDVILIGAGIMSATLGTMLKELAPEWNIKVFEKLDKAGEESSNEWNNAGTGHAALCELNYTPEKDGQVDVSKAININEQFQLSLQFWSYLTKKGLIKQPSDFIQALPHMSMVRGENNIEFLKKRFAALTEYKLFEGMEFSEDHEVLKEWMPLMMENRPANDKIAATKIDGGTDVNFGELTRVLTDQLQANGVSVNYKHSVENIARTNDGRWELKVKNEAEGKIEYHNAKFVFIGAGGKSLHLLQQTAIPESKQIGGFPVSGIFLVCKNEEIVNKHFAKVYGKAAVGAPPMSVPHLDTRFIDGKRSLLFGPFAGFSPKFLKTGSNMDLVTSVKPNNLFTMLSCGAKEMGLTKYLVQQLMLNKDQRIEELRDFIPSAQAKDWDIVVAGQRVQVIKDTPAGKGTLQFGTEVITSQDGSVAALLGASPGASTAVKVMLDIIGKCFPEQLPAWEDKIKEMVPSYGISLVENTDLLTAVKEDAEKTLKLK